MYKSLTKTKQYSELEAHETLKRVASANAKIKHYKSSSLITVKRHAMVLSFVFKANLVDFNLIWQIATSGAMCMFFCDWFCLLLDRLS